jgi:hypothetical protein
MKRRSPVLHIYMYVDVVAITWLVVNWGGLLYPTRVENPCDGPFYLYVLMNGFFLEYRQCLLEVPEALVAICSCIR